MNFRWMMAAGTMALLGGILAFLIYSNRAFDLEWVQHVSTCIFVTVLVSGVQLICSLTMNLARR